MTVAVDLLLAIGLVWLAVQAVSGQSLFRSIVMFVVFGLIMSLAWARLHAPDLALAEAAIGAGVTGALLLMTYRRVHALTKATKPPSTRPPTRLALPVSLFAAGMVGAIGIGAMSLEPGREWAGALALAHQHEVGLANPVTAVLLSFRAWDTLLEVAVLLVALAGARALADRAPRISAQAAQTAPLVSALLCIVVPLSLVVAVYLLRAGGHAPGGAFQAGAVLAAGGVLLVLTGRLAPVATPHWSERTLLVAGIVTFSTIGLAMLALGHPLLAMPGPWAIYLVETALMVSIAVPLLLLFAGGGGVRRPR